MRMLKLNHKAMRGTNISDVLFPGLPIVLDKFLAFGREVVFPCAVPVGFLFGPGITIPNSPVRPVPDSVIAALSNHGSPARWACSGKPRLSLATLAFNICELHSL